MVNRLFLALSPVIGLALPSLATLREAPANLMSCSSTCFAESPDGQLYGWGYNSNGQVGNGGTDRVTWPQAVLSSGPISVSAGSAHTLAVSATGSLYAWGAGSSGQLGTGNTSDQHYPAWVSDAGWVKAAAGSTHSAAIRSDGILFTWGDNADGELGLGAFGGIQTTPTEVYTAGELNNGWKTVSCGSGTTAGIKVDGTLWTWGFNDVGQLGQGNTTRLATPTKVINPATGQADRDWKDVAIGRYVVMALKTNGTVYTWGVGQYLGDGSTADRTRPGKVPSLSGIVSISASAGHLAALASSGYVYVWGNNNGGQLGKPINGVVQTTPIELPRPASNWVAIVAARSATMGVASDGTLYSIGTTGDDGEDPYNHPGSLHPINVPNRMGLGMLGAGMQHSALIMANGDLMTAGLGASGQLGTGGTGNAYSFTSVALQMVSTGIKAAKVFLGSKHSLVLAADGGAHAAGANNYGQLGISNPASQSNYFYAITGGSWSWTTLSAGESHSLGLNSDGMLYAWGRNTYGQLGDNSTTQRSIPVKISLPPAPNPAYPRTWIAISAGANHSAGILSDGSLWTWGMYSDGRLGVGTTPGNRLVPTQVKLSGLNDYRWVAVKCGYAHTVALRNDGTLWAWGDNYYKQIGNDGSADAFSPVQIGSGTVWTQISTMSASNHSVALDQYGYSWGWGLNWDYQLGDGTTTTRSHPVSLYFSPSHGVQAGGSFTLSRYNGLYGCGINNQGYLGVGNTSSATTPSWLAPFF